MLLRYVFGVSLGIVVTFILFVLMQSLIKSDRSAITEFSKLIITENVRVPDDVPPQIKNRRIDPPPEPDEPPPDRPKADIDPRDGSEGIEIGPVIVDPGPVVVGPDGFNSDGEYLPIVKVAPVYPRRAQTRGIEGYVLLEFVVTRTGAVRDPGVLESKPPGIFDLAAKKAALKFKYKPKVVNGVAIDVAGVRNRITFELTD